MFGKKKAKKTLSRVILTGLVCGSVLGYGGSAWAEILVDSDKSVESGITVEAGTATIESGSGRTYVIGAASGVDGTLTIGDGTGTITLHNDTGTVRRYGVAQNYSNSRLTINGNLVFDIPEGSAGVRAVAVRNNNGEIVINGNVSGKIASKNQFATVYDVWYGGASTTVNGNTEVEAIANGSISGNIPVVLQVNKDTSSGDNPTLTLKGARTEIIAKNIGNYTIQLSSDGTGIYNFDSTEESIFKLESAYGCNGFIDKGGSVYNFNSKKTIVETIVTDGVGSSNNIGLWTGDSSVVNVPSTVDEFTVNAYGNAIENDGADGAKVVYAVGSDLNIEAKKFNVHYEAGHAVEGKMTFDETLANGITDYAVAYGILADDGTTIDTGMNTDTTVFVKDFYTGSKNVFGIYAESSGVNLLGNVVVDTYTAGNGAKAYAVYAENDGIVTLGSEGKAVDIKAESDKNNYAIYAKDSNSKIELNGSANTITAKSNNGQAIAVYNEGGTITLNNVESIVADGNTEFGVCATGGTTNINSENLTIDSPWVAVKVVNQGTVVNFNVTGTLDIKGYVGGGPYGELNINKGSQQGKTNITVVNDRGMVFTGNASKIPGAHVHIGGEEFNINVIGGDRAIHIANNYLEDEEETKRAHLVINAEKTTVHVQDAEGNVSGAGIVAMSRGMIDINSNLDVTAEEVLYIRGNANVNINTDGKHTTKLNGDVNFGFEGTTSGSAIDSDVQINLTGKESYWNGNSLISWSNPSGKPDASLLAVTGFALTIADGAIWTPTYVEGLSENDPTATEGYFYNKVNTLTMNDGTNGGGVINVVEDNTKIPQVQTGVLNGTKGVVNMVDGAVFEVGVNDNKDLTVKGGKLVYSTDAEAKVDAGEKLTLDGTTLTQKMTSEGTLNISNGTVGVELVAQNGGTINLDTTTVEGKVSIGNIASGGGYGTLTVQNSTLNSGVKLSGGTVEATLTNSTLKGDSEVTFGSKMTVTGDAPVADGDTTTYFSNINGKITVSNIVKENNSLVISNTEVSDGGNIYTYATFEISDSEFDGVVADSAIHNEGGTTTISGTNFKNITGHAIYSNSGTVTIDGGVTFDSVTGNSSGGGAIESNNSTVFTINAKGENVTFNNNKNNGGAGGVVRNWLNGGTGVTFTIADAGEMTFIGNQGTQGGAISNEGTAEITANTINFAGNKAISSSGGAIYNQNGNISIVANVITFSGNSANPSEEKYGGGAFYQRASSNITAVIGKEGGTVVFSGNKSNTIGGAIGVNCDGSGNSTITINGTTTFDGNTSKLSGGAIGNNKPTSGSASAIIFNGPVTFTNNKAGVDLDGQAVDGSEAKGGAIRNNPGGSITFEKGSTFSGNTAAGKPNDIYNAGTLTFKGENTFAGGIEVAGASAQITVEGSVLLEKDAKLTFAEDVAANCLTVKPKANLTADLGNFVTLTPGATYKENAYTVVGAAKNAVNVEAGGILGMRYADFTYYTAGQCKLIYDNYKRGDADYILNLINAELKLETGEQLVIKADNDSQTANIQSTTPVVVDDKNNSTKVNIFSVPETYVQVVQNTTGSQPVLQSASTLNISQSTFAAKGLQVKDIGEADQATVNVKQGSTIVLVGDNEAGGSLVKDENNQPVRTKIVVEKDAVLNVGMKENTQEQKGAIADIEVNGDHTLDGNGAKTTEYAYGNMEIKKNANQEGNATVQILNAAGTVEQLITKKDSTLYLDPSYMNVYSLVDNTVSGNIYVGNGSVLEIGHLEGLRAAVKDAGFTVNDASTGFTVGSDETVLALGGSYKVASGAKLIVDSAVNASGVDANNTGNADVFFGPKSLLVINGDNHKAVGNVALTLDSSAKINVANTSKLYVQNAKLGETYFIVLDEVTDGDTWWQDANLKGNEFITLTGSYDATNKTYKVTTSKGEDTYKFEDTVIPGVATAMNSDTGSKAQDFLTPMLDNATWNGAEGHAAMVKDINAYANLGENLGVTRGAYDVANMVGDAVTNHWDNHAKGENIWAVYTHSKDKVDGLKLGGMDAKYDTQYNGVVVGADLNKDFGIALNYADGNVTNGYGGHNDAKYYGVSVYGRKNFGKVNLLGDVTYTHGKNELAQNGIEADAKTNTISAGLTAQYLTKAGKYGTIAPFAGVRYVRIDGKDYRDSIGVNREADKVNSVIVPMGVEYSGEFNVSGSDWHCKPVLALGYVFNLGDKDNTMTLGYNGAKDSFGYDFADNGAFFTKAALNFTKKNLTLGVGYDYMKSKNSKNNRWNVSVNVTF